MRVKSMPLSALESRGRVSQAVQMANAIGLCTLTFDHLQMESLFIAAVQARCLEMCMSTAATIQHCRVVMGNGNIVVSYKPLPSFHWAARDVPCVTSIQKILCLSYHNFDRVRTASSTSFSTAFAHPKLV